MNAIETLRMFADGQMSLHDIRALMISMGHSQEDFVNALSEVSTAGSWRVGKATKDELYSEIYLRTT